MSRKPDLAFFERIYTLYNKPAFIHPDPLELVLRYGDPKDQEVAGLIASSFALGNVTAILGCIEHVLSPLSSPSSSLLELSDSELHRIYGGFRYRFFSEHDLIMLLTGIRGCLREFGSLYAGFRSHIREEDADMLPALAGFVTILERLAEGPIKLLPSIEKGSACKRLHLFLRWMVRYDAVDPGPWRELSASKLIVPMDTHLLRISRRLGITRRNQAHMGTALEVTDFFRKLQPGDPVKYDFGLARLGIHPDLSYELISDHPSGPEKP